MAEASFILDGISCDACSWLIEHRMAQLKGVTKATLNLSNHRLFIQWNHDEVLVSSLIEALLRSEEHTSELQSRPHLVCRLLLEKKKKKKKNKIKIKKKTKI